VRKNTRSTSLLRTYGITLAEKEVMVKRQGGRCSICRRKVKTLCIDHDHDTGFVRGVLCWRCNQALGFFGDSHQSLARAIDYMDEAYCAWDKLSPDEQELWWPYRGRISGKTRAKRIAAAIAFRLGRPTLVSLESL